MSDESQYMQRVGEAVYKYAGIQYAITELGQRIAPNLYSMKDILKLGSVAHDYVILTAALAEDDPSKAESAALATAFNEATEEYLKLFETTPYGSSEGNRLGGSEIGINWTDDQLDSLQRKLTDLQGKADGLLSTFRK